MFKKDELRLLWPFYLTVLLMGSFAVINPIWVIFFSQKFTYFQISIGMALSSIAMILFEIPTGALADVLGRKFSVTLGIVLGGLTFIILPFINTPLLFYLALFLMGVFATLRSGEDEAWMIDRLKRNRKEGLIHDMYIKIQSFYSLGFVLGPLFATLLLFFFEMKHLFFIQGSGFILANFILIFFAKEDFHKKKAKIKEIAHNTLHTSKKGFTLLFKNKTLFYLVLAAVFASFSAEFGIVAWQPLLVNLSLPIRYLGIVFSAVSLIGIVTPFLTKRLLKKIGHEKIYLAVTTLAEFIVLAFLYFIEKPLFLYGAIVYLLVNFARDLRLPIRLMYFQSFVPSKIRATVTSAQSMILSVVSFISIIVGGYFIDRIGPKMTLVYFALFLIPASISYMLIKRKSRL